MPGRGVGVDSFFVLTGGRVLFSLLCFTGLSVLAIELVLRYQDMTKAMPVRKEVLAESLVQFLARASSLVKEDQLLSEQLADIGVLLTPIKFKAKDVKRVVSLVLAEQSTGLYKVMNGVVRTVRPDICTRQHLGVGEGCARTTRAGDALFFHFQEGRCGD